ncbi:MAG: MBL fold metallo-hydrolase [Planctomycetota bacterium]|nr:MBL fold metallo-hydrolase [Planctomycetota bacterium]
MKLRLLPSSLESELPGSPAPRAQPLTSFIVTGTDGAGPVAIDAGSLGMVGDAAAMARVEEVVLTHSHIDHVATLPMWIEACLSEGRAPVRVHAARETVEALRAHLFNDVLYADFESMTDAEGRALLEWALIPSEGPFSVAGLRMESIPAAHTVPTRGFVVEDGERAVLFAADSGPNPGLWAAVAARPGLAAVVLETSFPDAMGDVALGSGHLTPGLLAAELRHAPADLRVLVAHLKPAYRDEVARALEAIEDPRIELLRPGVEVEL